MQRAQPLLRTVRGIEVTDETLSFEVIKNAALGDGHFLAQAQTLERMERDYYYGKLVDRSSFEDWEEQGGLDIRQRARTQVRRILSEYYPPHYSDELDHTIRGRFEILLPPAAIRPGDGRWSGGLA